MRRRTLFALFPLVVLARGGRSGPRAAAQSATPAASAPEPGKLAAASREFDATGASQTGIIGFQFRVARFDTVAHARSALATAEVSLRANRNIAKLKVLPELDIADEAAAYAGEVTQNGAIYSVAVLLARDGVDDHDWTAVAVGIDPLSDLLAIARRFFARASTPDATVSPANLLNRLPKLTDLPSESFLLADEQTENAAGTPTPSTGA